MIARRGLATALVCAALLTGCSRGSDSADDADPTPGPGKPLQTLAADGLPADFPRDEVPIVDGEVTSVEEGTAKSPGYAVAVVVLGVSESEAKAQAVELLQKAGWEQVSDEGQVSVLTKGTDMVVLTSSTSGDRTLVSYAVDLSTAPVS